MNSGIKIDISNGVALITIDRQNRRNALDHAALLSLNEKIRRCADDSAIRVIILTGAGTQAFSAGDDLKEIVKLDQAELIAHTRLGQELTAFFTIHPCLIIAAVEGYCLGGGLEFALACDMRIASESATFGLPEVVRYNALPTWGGTHRLTKIVGQPRAREMILFGRQINAHDAQNWGLVSEVVDEGNALGRALAIARDIPPEASRNALSTAKRLITQSAETPLAAASYMEFLAERTLAGEVAFEAHEQRKAQLIL